MIQLFNAQNDSENFMSTNMNASTGLNKSISPEDQLGGPNRKRSLTPPTPQSDLSKKTKQELVDVSLNDSKEKEEEAAAGPNQPRRVL